MVVNDFGAVNIGAELVAGVEDTRRDEHGLETVFR